jgi:hypothetical protein
VGFFDNLFGGGGIEAREAEFAGDVYPADADELEDLVRLLLSDATASEVRGLRALIAPHAAYEFAGRITADAYASLPDGEPGPNRVVVLGASRLVPFQGLALDAWEGFQTPLGVLEYPSDGFWDDAPASVRRMAAAFDPDESIETQLPFVQVACPQAQLVPVLAGDTKPDDVVDALEWLVDEKTLLVLSANLSQDVGIERAAQLDAEAESAIVDGRPEAIRREHTASRIAMRGVLKFARRRGWSAQCVARSNSAEQGGASDSVVGYGSFAFS